MLVNQRSRAAPLGDGAADRLAGNLETRCSSGSTSLAGQLMSRQIELRQLRALAETTALINSSLDTDSVLNQVMDTVIQLTGAERGYIMLTNKASGALEFRIARGIDREQLGPRRIHRQQHDRQRGVRQPANLS